MIYYFLFILSYILGSVPFGLLIAKLYKIDIRKVGSGNIGATNVARSCGKLAGVLTFLLDFYKGIIVLIIARIYLNPTHDFELLICFFAIIGHAFPVFLKFKGGKCVAISFACLMVLYPSIAISLAIFWSITFAIFMTVGISSISAAVLLLLSAIQMIIFTQNIPTFAFLAFTSLLIIIKHIPNIKDIRTKLSYAK